MSKISKMIAAVFTQFLNVGNLSAEPPGVGDMFDRLDLATDFESTLFWVAFVRTVGAN
jgi:hypothetical protein